MFKSPSPQQLIRYEQELAARRPPFQPKRGRPAVKLLAKSVLGLPVATVRNWTRRSSGGFPSRFSFTTLSRIEVTCWECRRIIF